MPRFYDNLTLSSSRAKRFYNNLTFANAKSYYGRFRQFQKVALLSSAARAAMSPAPITTFFETLTMIGNILRFKRAKADPEQSSLGKFIKEHETAASVGLGYYLMMTTLNDPQSLSELAVYEMYTVGCASTLAMTGAKAYDVLFKARNEKAQTNNAKNDAAHAKNSGKTKNKPANRKKRAMAKPKGGLRANRKSVLSRTRAATKRKLNAPK